MNPIQVIIVDDERAAREEMKRALQMYPDITVVGEAQHADDACELIRTKKPDLVFLDIQLPEKDGFALLAALETVPEVIFTTAYHQYAVQAFDCNALDYLMKPIREERLEKALEKVREKLMHKTEQQQTLSMNRRIFIREGTYSYYIRIGDIYLAESVGNYARLYFQDKKTYLKTSLNLLEEKLDIHFFFRINRTQLVNIDFITRVHPLAGGRLQLTLQNGQLLEVSGRQAVKFRTRL
ncbi:LytR/AlgR family response regulator transcription factor [Chitinophaga nivalis]|uniref:Response regulator transcription factor n=1 Tax=Chitinophaga nivalis TaxID=2991709 RepID=A0ABT3ILC1_9BACT|nr:response regulator transcription factor [Chitinophaga nivalis]MCW3465739.1 response regulator transcription factor [Chitinophaga nivalis]MCW3484570.1 response regulator transcription factor [Chitinophaga nivalis]